MQCDVLAPTDNENQQYSYSVRFTNPDQRSKFVTKIWHDMHDKFMSVSILKQKACESFEDKLDETEDL